MSAVIYSILATFLGLIFFRKSREWKWGKCISKHSLKGKTFLITGASSGIGKETVRQLLERNAAVIVGNRDLQKMDQAVKEIRKSTSSGELIIYQLDLASFSSIKTFAYNVNQNHARIDVLINNAGVSVPLSKGLHTKQNFELNIGINHFGHFLLTSLLLKKLKDSAPSRIVIVSSTLHEKGSIDLEDLNSSQYQAVDIGYCNSKLANVYHGRELAERLMEDNIDVRLVCPGWCYTGLFRYSNPKWWQYILISPIAFVFMRTAWQGSQTVVYCATEKELPGNTGDFYRDCKLYRSKANLHPELQKQLWDKSVELTSR